MGSSYSESLERLVSQLELEAQLYDNKTARQYLSSLQQYMDTVSLTFVHSKGAPDYETDAGIAWVVAVPFIFFSSVALVMTILLIFFRHSENFKTECKSAEQSHVGADNPLHNSSGNNAESRHDQERAVIIDCHGNSATNKGGAFLRGYVNAAGELEGASRASGASKGSVRSLGVLTDLNDGRLERPQMYGLHSNPPPAPSTLTRHGLTTFEMLARRRLSRSIDELRDLKEGGRQATVPSDWSSLGTIGGRTSLEMNVTSEAPQLTLLESDLATKELPPSKRFSTSIDSLNENASRDSLRASMEFHISKGSGSGLGPDDLYRDRKRKSTGGSKPKSCHRKQEYSLSSSSLDTASRSGSRLGNVNLSFVKSDIDSANSQTESNTYTEILNFDKPHINKSAENVNYVNCVVKQPQRFDNPLFSNSCHQPATCEYAQNTYDNVDNITKRNGTNAMCTAATMTNTVGSNTADIITVGRGLVEPTRQGEKYPERVFPSQTLDSWSSSSDIASSSYRSRSPLRRGRPLSLDILSSWSSDLENQGGRPRLSAPRKPVTRQLFATTPQMAKKRVEDYSLFNDSASRSAPSRKAVANPFNFELKSFVPLNAPRQTTKQVGHPHSKSNTQESSLSFQETAIASAKSEALLKMKTPHSPDSDSFYETKAGKVQSQPIAKKLVERHVYDNPKQRPAIFRKDHKHHKSSLTQLGDAYLTTTSNLSSGASGWTSSGSSEKQRGDLDRTESSADSTIESISSSLAPFHAKRAGEQEMPRAKYRLPQEVRTTDSEPDEGVTSESNTRPELDVSLEPNPGSCNHSLEEATCPQSPVILKVVNA